MKRKSIIAILVGMVVIVGGLTGASIIKGYNGLGFYQWDPTVPNYNPSTILHPGTIDTSQLVTGDFLGVSPTQQNAPGWGDSGSAAGWDDCCWVYWAGDGNTNGDNLDGKWVHIIYPSEGWWDLGFATNKVVVFLSQDHGPYLGEGLETRVYGSNTLWGPVSSQAVLTEIYLDGWRSHNPAEDGNGNGWSSDDIAGVYELPGNYRYIKIAAWSSIPTYDEPEVDAVAAFRVAPPPVCPCEEITARLDKIETELVIKNQEIDELKSWRGVMETWKAEVNEKLEWLLNKVGAIQAEITEIWEKIKKVQEEIAQLFKKVNFLNYLPRGLKEQMVCGYLKDNPAESPLTEFGLTCELKEVPGKACVCK